jgi:hypothetical protein
MDWEWRIGGKTKNAEVMYLAERENGKYCRGYNIKYNPYKPLHIVLYNKEAYHQWYNRVQYNVYNKDGCYIGCSLYNSVSQPLDCQYTMGMKSKYINFDISVGGVSWTYYGKLSKKMVYTTVGHFVEPFISYRNIDGRVQWQSKIVWGWQLRH